jgi:hypothetical protein
LYRPNDKVSGYRKGLPETKLYWPKAPVSEHAFLELDKSLDITIRSRNTSLYFDGSHIEIPVNIGDEISFANTHGNDNESLHLLWGDKKRSWIK